MMSIEIYKLFFEYREICREYKYSNRSWRVVREVSKNK